MNYCGRIDCPICGIGPARRNDEELANVALTPAPAEVKLEPIDLDDTYEGDHPGFSPDITPTPDSTPDPDSPVRDLGFGTTHDLDPDSDSNSDSEIARVPKKPLTYQKTAIEAIHDVLQTGRNRVGATTPTGAGNALIFATYIRNRLKKHRKGKALMLVGSNMQAVQAKVAIEDAYGTEMALIGEEHGGRQAAGRSQIIVATWQTLQDRNRMEQFKKRFNIAEFKLVVVDEAHHSVSNAYLQILSEFNDEIEIHNSSVYKAAPTHGFKTPILGLSATFVRTDKRALSWVYETMAYECTLEELWKDNYLAPVKIWRASTENGEPVDAAALVRVRDGLVTPINQVATLAGGPEMLEELTAEEMDRLTETEKFYKLVLQAYQDQAQGRRSTLIFAKSLVDVNNLVEAFENASIETKAATSESSKTENQDNIASFERGDCAVLITCRKLIEGFNAPHIDCIILAKPTKSPIDHNQMVGRGLQNSHGTGKTDCLILDLVGNCDRIALGVKPNLGIA